MVSDLSIQLCMLYYVDITNSALDNIEKNYILGLYF